MNAAKRLVLALPATFLLLSLDRLAPEPPPFGRFLIPSWEQAAISLPPTNEGRFGLPGDALNLVFIGTPQAVRTALTDAGWTEVPTSVRGSLVAGFQECLDGKPLAAFPPMNDYRLIGRRQNMNWARPVRPLEERHHFRLWATGMMDSSGRDVWWGSGNYDLSIRWRDFSHRPDPDMDRERDFITATLTSSHLLESLALVPMPQIPRAGANDKGYSFHNDGRAALIVLKPSPR